MTMHHRSGSWRNAGRRRDEVPLDVLPEQELVAARGSMDGEAVTSARRRWRHAHQPPIRRSDPIFDLAEWILPIASIAMLLAGVGVSKREPMPLELSAVLVVAGATVIGVLLLAVTVRLVVKPGIAPFSRAGAITLTCISIISPVLLWARSEGVVTPLVVAAIVANALCLLVGALALVMSRVRTQ